MINIKFSLPRAIRIKLNNACQYNCKFCHKEGNGSASEINAKELIIFLKKINKKLYFYRVHFTGGEPTLYKGLIDLLKETKKLALINSLTTNGQFNPDFLLTLKKAGLDSINFSVHTLEKFSFLKIQNHHLPPQSGRRVGPTLH